MLFLLNLLSSICHIVTAIKSGNGNFNDYANHHANDLNANFNSFHNPHYQPFPPADSYYSSPQYSGSHQDSNYLAGSPSQASSSGTYDGTSTTVLQPFPNDDPNFKNHGNSLNNSDYHGNQFYYSDYPGHQLNDSALFESELKTIAEQRQIEKKIEAFKKEYPNFSERGWEVKRKGIAEMYDKLIQNREELKFMSASYKIEEFKKKYRKFPLLAEKEDKISQLYEETLLINLPESEDIEQKKDEFLKKHSLFAEYNLNLAQFGALFGVPSRTILSWQQENGLCGYFKSCGKK